MSITPREHNLFKKKFKYLSNTNIFLRKISSSSIKNNNLLIHKDSSKTNFHQTNLQSNPINKFNINLTSKKPKPFKIFSSENKIKAFDNSNPKTKITRTIMNYNSNIITSKTNNILADYKKKFISSKTKKFDFSENKKRTPNDTNTSRSSDKSSSIFITGNQNNNNYNQKYKRYNNLKINDFDNFGNLIDPLAIPEEDKIFDELNKINCLTERYENKYKNKGLFKNIFEKKDDLKEIADALNNGTNLNKKKGIENIMKNKGVLNNFSRTFYNQNHFKLTLEDKDLLDTLYMTSDEYFDKLDKIKKTKKKQKLKDYQNELLDLIKPVISIYGFSRLKNKFEDIKKLNSAKKDWDFEYLHKLENNEEMIINDINYLYNKYLKNENNKSNYFSKYNPKNFELDLPNIEFKRVLKIEDEEEEKLKEFLKKKDKEKKTVKKIKESLNKKEDNNKINKGFNINSSINKNLIDENRSNFRINGFKIK